jgi:hypothetical protein
MLQATVKVCATWTLVDVVHRSGKFSVEFSTLLGYGRQSGVTNIWQSMEICVLSFIITGTETVT